MYRLGKLLGAGVLHDRLAASSRPTVRIITVREANKDPEFKKRSVTDLQYDRHIRNIYKVLLTRGMVGTVVYAIDPQTQEFLAELIETTIDRRVGHRRLSRADAEESGGAAVSALTDSRK